LAELHRHYGQEKADGMDANTCSISPLESEMLVPAEFNRPFDF